MKLLVEKEVKSFLCSVYDIIELIFHPDNFLLVLFNLERFSLLYRVLNGIYFVMELKNSVIQSGLRLFRNVIAVIHSDVGLTSWLDVVEGHLKSSFQVAFELVILRMHI